MQVAETNLFGEPRLDLEQSQLMTPPALARRMAEWVPRRARVIEQCCGTGNLIEGLLDVGHDPALILGVERDPRLAVYARDRFEGKVEILCADVLTWTKGAFLAQLGRAFDLSLMNPPFEENQHTEHVLHGLSLAYEVVGVFPVTFPFTQERDRELWATRAQWTKRALLPERVKYAGAGGSFESEVLRIISRQAPRRYGDVRTVYEETWLLNDGGPMAHLAEVS